MKKQLSEEQKRICLKKGTEAPFSGQYDAHFQLGEYHCVNCQQVLFTSASKFDAGCGWPSFSEALKKGCIAEHEDLSQGTLRTEICCSNCGIHLGHVFADGPTETGLRYCVNSVSLGFSKK